MISNNAIENFSERFNHRRRSSIDIASDNKNEIKNNEDVTFSDSNFNKKFNGKGASLRKLAIYNHLNKNRKLENINNNLLIKNTIKNGSIKKSILNKKFKVDVNKDILKKVNAPNLDHRLPFLKILNSCVVLTKKLRFDKLVGSKKEYLKCKKSMDRIIQEITNCFIKNCENSLYLEYKHVAQMTRLRDLVESKINFIETFANFNLNILKWNESCDKIKEKQLNEKYSNVKKINEIERDIFSVKEEMLSCDKVKYINSFGSEYVESCLSYISKKIDGLNSVILQIKQNNVI